MAHDTRTDRGDDLITTSTAAQILERPESTVRLWENRGVITAAHRTPTGVRLYHRADIERLAITRGPR